MRGISVPIRGAYRSGGIPKPPSPTCHWCSSIESRRVHFLVVLETHCLRQSSSMQQRAFMHATCQPFHFSNERPRTTRSHRYRSSSRREPARVSPNIILILQRRRSMAAVTRPGRRHCPGFHRSTLIMHGGNDRLRLLRAHGLWYMDELRGTELIQ